MKKLLICLLVLISFSCKKEKEVKPASTTAPSSKEKKFVMYQMSEMATLMEQMYVDNLRLKEKIKKGEALGDFPAHFLKIHTAKMTDDSDNDAFFKEQAALYIKAQQQIYSDPKNAKEHFNKGVAACLSCHQEKCGGPIPKIKKLYIK